MEYRALRANAECKCPYKRLAMYVELLTASTVTTILTRWSGCLGLDQDYLPSCEYGGLYYLGLLLHIACLHSHEYACMPSSNGSVMRSISLRDLVLITQPLGKILC